MENRPVISLSGRSRAPGADIEAYERYKNWSKEVYGLMTLKRPQSNGIDSYEIIKENPQYPERLSTSHFRSLGGWKDAGTEEETKAMAKEQNSWTERGIVDQVWYAVYSLIKGFRNKAGTFTVNETTLNDSAPVMHIEAYRLSPEEQDHYYKWFNDYGISIFVPIIMRIPGLLGYDWYLHVEGIHREHGFSVQEYPKYVSLLYFENLPAFEAYQKGPEIAGLYRAMRSVLPNRLTYEWYVQYQLVRRLRK